MKINICLFLIAVITLSGCMDIPDFSSVPSITYNGISQYTTEYMAGENLQKVEIVTLSVNFEDREGDLGASSDDRQNPLFREAYLKAPNWGHEGNYELVTMALNDDGKTWREYVQSEDEAKFFKDLKPDGKPGPIKGKLELEFRALYSPNGNTPMQRRKYKVRIIDRAFHISNTSEPSDEVLVPIGE